MIFTFETTIFTKTLTELHTCDVCVRTELSRCCLCQNRTANVLMIRVQNYECVTCAGTGVANAYTKCDKENPFPGTQVFVQARNNEYKYDKGTKNVLNSKYIRKQLKNCAYYYKKLIYILTDCV